MRAIWKGAVSFGLVSVPVKLYAATESHDVSFRQVHAKDGGRIKYQRVCSLDGEEVAYADIAKGYETEDGEMVILTDDDMAELPSTSSREIAVEKFVPREQIDPLLFEKSYYLEPEGAGAKPYALLRQALLDADRMAVVTVALRQRTTIAVLRVKDDVIVLQTMMWPDEIRTPDFSVETGEVKDAEVKMAHMLVETLAGDFDASEFEDDYAGAVEAQQVEHHERGGHRPHQPCDLPGVAHVHAVLEHAEVGDAAVVEGDHLAVDEQVAVAERRRAEVGPGSGDVVVVAAGHPGDAVVDVDEHPDAVPLHLVKPLRAGRHAVGLAGEHGAHAGKSGTSPPGRRSPLRRRRVSGAAAIVVVCARSGRVPSPSAWSVSR